MPSDPGATRTERLAGWRETTMGCRSRLSIIARLATCTPGSSPGLQPASVRATAETAATLMAIGTMCASRLVRSVLVVVMSRLRRLGYSTMNPMSSFTLPAAGAGMSLPYTRLR